MVESITFPEFSPTIRKIYGELSTHVPLITIGERSYMMRAHVDYASTDVHILIGSYSSLGRDLNFSVGLNHDYHSLTTYPLETILASNEKPTESQDDRYNRHQIIIGNDVWIGSDVKIMGGVRIGNGAVIGGSTVVAKDVPPYAVVVGNPARIVKYRFDDATIARLRRIKWWNWPPAEIEKYIPQFRNDMDTFLAAFDPQDTEPPVDEIGETVAALREQGIHVSYFVPDFEADPAHAVWPRTLDSYLAAYTAEDRTALILAIPEGEAYQPYHEAIQSRLAAEGANAPLVLSHASTPQQPFSIPALRAADACITTRSAISSVCVDYAADGNAAIRYGLDRGALLFPPVG